MDMDMNNNRTPARQNERPVRLDETRDVTQTEHNLKFWDAVRQYPKACFWASFFCLGVIAAGFDVQLITSFFALPAFQRRYGTLLNNNEFVVSAAWQTALGMGNPIGQIVGGLASGWPLERFGRRRTLAMCCVWSAVFVFAQFFASSIVVLCVGQILAGLSIGFYVVIAPTYASEVCPLALRGVLTTLTNLAFVVGQLLAQGIVAGFESRLDQWAYRAPFALQWLWPVCLLFGMIFAPESPYWLVRKGRTDLARINLLRLVSVTNPPDIDAIIILIEHTNSLEMESQKSTYWECFQDTNLIRTEICTLVYTIQVIAGNPLIGWVNFFFVQAGLPSKEAFKMGVGNTAMGLAGTCISWWLLSLFGRRTIYMTGLALMTAILFIIGFLDIGDAGAPRSVIWAQATMMNVWTFVYQMTVGPIAFVIMSEISSTRLRGRTIAVATAIQAVSSTVFTVAMPYMLGSLEADWGGKSGFFFGTISLSSCVWCFFRLAETRGRTYEELNLLFASRVSPRDFSKVDTIGNADCP